VPLPEAVVGKPPLAVIMVAGVVAAAAGLDGVVGVCGDVGVVEDGVVWGWVVLVLGICWPADV